MVISIHHRKGGVGKTTTAQHLGAVSALQNQKTLLIDFDGQGNLTDSVGFKDFEYGTAEVLRAAMNDTGEITDISQGIYEIKSNLHLMPGCNKLFKVQQEIANFVGNRGELLNDLLKSIGGWGFNVIIIDTPPSDGWLVANALLAADCIYTPVACEAFAIDGIAGLSETLGELGRKNKRKLAITRLIPTRMDGRIKEHSEYLSSLRKRYGDLVTQAIIRTDSNIPKSQTENLSIFEFAKTSRAAVDYRNLAKEIFTWAA